MTLSTVSPPPVTYRSESRTIAYQWCFRLAAAGAPFRVKERRTGNRYLAQLKPFEEAKRGLETHNVLEHPNVAQYKQVIHDKDLAIVVYEEWVILLVFYYQKSYCSLLLETREGSAENNSSEQKFEN